MLRNEELHSQCALHYCIFTVQLSYTNKFISS